MSDELILEIDPPYIGSAVSPTVDITETTNDVTVTITDFRGEHAYTVDKTDQAIEDAEQAASNANTAAANATSTANAAAQYARQTADQAAADAQATADEAAGRADTAAASATSAAQAATTAAGTANTAAQNADTKAALADSKATLANQAATTANQAAEAAEAAKTAANTAAGQATTAAGNANTAAGTANTAAGNADVKAALADTAATNADTATQAANTATTAATNAAQAANSAADVAIEAAETITDGYFPKMLAGAAEALMGDTGTATFAERVSTHDGVARIEAIQGNTVVNDGNLLNVNMEGVRTVGFNQWDEEWETGGINHTTGEDTPNPSTIRSKNYIPVIHGTQYYTRYNTYMHYYDANKEYISYAYVATVFTVPDNACFARFNTESAYGGTYKHDICINISDPTRNGEYKPYTTDTRNIDIATYFPDGMKSAGSIHDELTISKAVKRVGVVDLGALSWSTATASGGNIRFVNTTLKTVIAKQPDDNAAANVICMALPSISANKSYQNNLGIAVDGGGNVYGNDLVSTSATAFQAAMSGVMLYYELATPVETEITPPLTMTYTVEQGGTEQIVIPTGENSAAPTLAIVYGLTADGVADKALSVIAPIEGATASTNYSVNAYLVHDQQLYRVTSAIATGEAITPGSNCVACTVMGEVIRLTA